ncbi:MAG TPA: hypothetical protein VMD30_09550 [Tepidisphaeraceae bacterium]|nr:hypothetical protein [Tepidisphaeraceae bacterium]
MRHAKGFAFKASVLSMAAAAALSIGAGRAMGQYQVNADGHALDANNRYGSNGYNSSSSNVGQLNQVNNQLIYGNTSGLFSFQGQVPFGDPRAFTGNLPATPSQELQQIAGPPPENGAPTNVPQPIYSVDKDGAPPPGYNPIVGAGTYVPAPPEVRQPQDARLGYLPDELATPLPPPGSVNAGPVDAQADVTPDYLVQSSPLYGIRGLQMGFSGQGVYSAPTVSAEGAYGQQLSSDDILQYRLQLQKNLVPGANALQPNSSTNVQQNNTAQSTPSGATTLQGQTTNTLGSQQLRTTVVGSRPLVPTDLTRSTLLSSSASSNALNSRGANTGQYTATLLPPPPPPQQITPEYAALQAKLQQFNSMHPQTQAQADQIFQQELQLRNAYEKQQAANLGGAVPVNPGGPMIPAPSPQIVPNAPLNSGAGAVQPVPIGPLSNNVKAPGLHELLSQGEQLSAQQKFKEAIDKFDQARAVAPNDPLIWMEEANAELGAGYYARAESDLRYAFSHDPSLLMATYDINTLIGPQRLQQLIADLKQNALQGDSETPVFLLAYLSYNTGDASKALQYLDLAQRRAGGQDDLIRQLRDHWALPSTRP